MKSLKARLGLRRRTLGGRDALLRDPTSDVPASRSSKKKRRDGQRRTRKKRIPADTGEAARSYHFYGAYQQSPIAPSKFGLR